MGKRRRLALVGAVVAAAALVPLAWWLASPLFIDRAVQEAFPVALPTQRELQAMPAAERERVSAEVMDALPEPAQLDAMPPRVRDEVAERVQAIAADMPGKQAVEPMPAAAPQRVAQGMFADADRFHRGSGTATLYRLDGGLVLRFEQFQVTNGPDLHVLLATGDDPRGGDQYVDLGQLKGNIGDQNYPVPTTVSDSHRTVVIYCVPFHVVFATARLS